MSLDHIFDENAYLTLICHRYTLMSALWLVAKVDIGRPKRKSTYKKKETQNPVFMSLKELKLLGQMLFGIIGHLKRIVKYNMEFMA
ncbi:hypothetical protein L6452_23244 [Arctium lappa]|uniref:Uncharacterized protein n=1 Tax=Arctium lappa TaxID=4217 RepID=A0ACB9B214_ARCLA|nr:hypothetical protein L6452_23244 [Arctium lappa]